MTNIRQIKPDEPALLRGMLALFAEVFGEPDTYLAKQPDDAWLQELLASRNFIALAALAGHEVVGALAAYELKKYEQARTEIYIYDLAVSAAWRRRGIATALIGELQRIAAERDAWVIYVQADTNEEDEAAIALYSKLGSREEVLHFDIPPLKILKPSR